MSVPMRCLCISLVMVTAVSECSAQDRPFTVRDDISMVRFSDPLPNHGIPGSENVSRSPDGKHFAVVTTKGLLDSDQIESDIILFDRDEISAFLNDVSNQPPKPRVIASIISFPHREEANAYAPVIKDLHWAPDAANVYFKGEALTGTYRLYVAKIDGSGFHALTSESISVGRFDVAKDLIVFTASQPQKDSVPRGDWINPDTQVLTGRNLLDVLFPGQLSTIIPETFTMEALHDVAGKWYSRTLPKYSVREVPYLSFLFPFALSPKGDKLIGTTPISSIPDSWKEYDPASGFEHLRFQGNDPRRTSVDLIQRPQQYSLIDLKNGNTVPLVDAPNARILAYSDNNRIAWAKDERRVLITNTFLPIDPRDPSNSIQKRMPCAVASVDLPSLNDHCLFFEKTPPQPNNLHVQEISFGEDDDEALVLAMRGTEERDVLRYSFQNDKWTLRSSSPVIEADDAPVILNRADRPPKTELRLIVTQGLNMPPNLWAEEIKEGKTRKLWDPNPQFHHILFGDASLYRWKDQTGYEWSGVLVKPVNYVSNVRYPLVLQMYSFEDGQFITDGLYPTAFAARHLASAGFAVLQIKRKPTRLSENDPQDALEGYRSAVDALAKTGLIDRDRVGVVGFSWTCWYVVDALIKEPKLFAAATIADGLDNSYMQYLLTVESRDVQKQMETIYGAAPFGAGLKRWEEQAPGFHLDQVQTPVRIEAINPMSVLQEWELYASLRTLDKPVDLIYFPHGTHIHQKPLERLESQQGDVDWFRFWLQGYESPNPDDPDQYKRWERLRELRDADARVAPDQGQKGNAN